MNRNAIICAIEHALRDEGCNEVKVAELNQRVLKTRGHFNLGQMHPPVPIAPSMPFKPK